MCASWPGTSQSGVHQGTLGTFPAFSIHSGKGQWGNWTPAPLVVGCDVFNWKSSAETASAHITPIAVVIVIHPGECAVRDMVAVGLLDMVELFPDKGPLCFIVGMILVFFSLTGGLKSLHPAKSLWLSSCPFMSGEKSMQSSLQSFQCCLWHSAWQQHMQQHHPHFLLMPR